MARGFTYFALTIILWASAVASREISAKLDGQVSIIGGHDADIKDHPYQVALFYKYMSSIYMFVCGGMIISKDYILTAAHCVESYNASVLLINSGSSWSINGTHIQAEEVIIHPEYIPYDNDAALIRTKEPIQFTDFIQPVKLPFKQKPLEDDSLVTVAGWGLTETKHGSKHLRSVQIPVVNFYKCWTSYRKVSVTVTRNMWCGGDFEKGGAGPCVGDSGGAAVQDNVTVGIVSWATSECGTSKHPAVFTDIAAPSIRDFITNHTGL